LGGASNVIKEVGKFVNRVPSPEDLELIGGELFRLLSIELLTDDKGLGKSTENHININKSGKLRLIQMGLSKPIKIRGLGKNKEGEQDITYLGSRRLWKTADLPDKTLAQWPELGDTKKETVYEFVFAAATKGVDLVETNDLLEKSGYLEPAIADKTVFGDDLAKRLRTFQKLNGLTVNGKLDNSTLNRLMNFNFESNSIERAVPYDASKLPAGFDNSKDIAA
jgi:hypothetical protein